MFHKKHKTNVQPYSENSLFDVKWNYGNECTLGPVRNIGSRWLEAGFLGLRL